MNEIKCPKCGEVFQVDESGYAAIIKQIRDKEFNKELESREKLFSEEKENAVKIAEAEMKNNLSEELAKKENEIIRLKAEMEKNEGKKELEVSKVVSEKDKEIAELKAQLKSQNELNKSEKELAVSRALAEKETEIVKLNAELQSEKQEREIQKNALKEQYEKELSDKDELIERYKDMKIKLSTKMVGESLEQHCEIEFNKLRATAFRNAYFEKDNDATAGSKGDYIYRETDENGVEIISIMFEMKNEMDTTATKHKNEDFFKKLDKDRIEKGCEYAVLVTLLEADNEYYNSGIVDVSHKYDKMYVIRPQFFIPMITVLRNAALNSLECKQELALVKNQNIDITNFEQNLLDFKDSFSKNYQHAHERFNDAIAEIDKSIDHLQKIKENLTKSDSHLRTANNKIDNVSIKKLTKGNPTMTAKFAELKENNE